MDLASDQSDQEQHESRIDGDERQRRGLVGSYWRDADQDGERDRGRHQRADHGEHAR